MQYEALACMCYELLVNRKHNAKGIANKIPK